MVLSEGVVKSRPNLGRCKADGGCLVFEVADEHSEKGHSAEFHVVATVLEREVQGGGYDPFADSFYAGFDRLNQGVCAVGVGLGLFASPAGFFEDD